MVRLDQRVVLALQPLQVSVDFIAQLLPGAVIVRVPIPQIFVNVALPQGAVCQGQRLPVEGGAACRRFRRRGRHVCFVLVGVDREHDADTALSGFLIYTGDSYIMPLFPKPVYIPP